MTKKQIKAFLAAALYIKQEIDRLEDHIATLSSLREKVTPSYSDMPGGGGALSKVENLTIKILELEEQSRLRIGDYLEQYTAVSAMISSLREVDMRYVTVLGLRYLEGNDWGEIADCLHYSRRMVIYLHDKAIDELERRNKNGKIPNKTLPKMPKEFSKSKHGLDA